jgi:hypothetical protein
LPQRPPRGASPATRHALVRHKYAARIAVHARAKERHAHMLVRLRARIIIIIMLVY